MTSRQEQSKKNGAGFCLFIVGEHHLGEKDEAFREQMARLAGKGRIALGLEGIIRNPAAEKACFRALYGVEDGLVFGIENDLVNQYTGTILHFNYMVHAGYSLSFPGSVSSDIREMVSVSKAQLVYDVTESEFMRTCWSILGAMDLSENVKKLYDGINAIIARNSGVRERIQDFAKSEREFSLVNDWVVLFRLLASEMAHAVRNVPNELAPNFEPIERYLKNPIDNDAWEYIHKELNIGWRDKFLLKNILEISEIASAKRVNPYIIVGRSHVGILSSMIAEKCPDLDLKRYDSSESIPSEEIPI